MIREIGKALSKAFNRFASIIFEVLINLSINNSDFNFINTLKDYIDYRVVL